jgi:hypothetical protein
MTCARRPSLSAAAGPASLAAAALVALGRLGLAALIVFHAWLLGAHLVDGQAFEPATAVRWMLAVIVLAGFRALSRRGLPLLLGRRAVVLWLLVVVIHCSAASDGAAAAALGRAIPESVTALAQISVTTLLLGAVLAIALAAVRQPRKGGRPAGSAPTIVAGLPSSGFVFCFSPRPPPLA